MTEVYYVGGCIRDKILNKTTPDKDLVVVGESAENYANSLDGRVVLLDSENQIYRVVMKDKTYFDVTSTNNLALDAKRRDFTINSIYQNLETGEFFDPYEGRNAIKNKIIKTVDLKNLNDDPLRMLRAFRFAATLGFKIDEEILDFISKNHAKISNVALERVNYELLKMFEGDFVVQSLRLAHKTGLLAEIFPFIKEIEKIPPNTHHHLALLEHSFETINNLQIKNSPSWPLLRIAALMHDIGKPKVWTIEPDSGRHRFIGHDTVGGKLAAVELKRLKFSRKQIDFISKMVVHHIYPSALMASVNETKAQSASEKNRANKALIRFVKKLEPYVPEIIDLARADRLSAQGPAISKERIQENLKNLDELLKFYEQIKPKLVDLPKLLDGNEVMELLNLAPQKRLGEILAQLNEAQLEGAVNNKEQAIEFVKKNFSL